MTLQVGPGALQVENVLAPVWSEHASRGAAFSPVVKIWSPTLGLLHPRFPICPSALPTLQHRGPFEIPGVWQCLLPGCYTRCWAVFAPRGSQHWRRLKPSGPKNRVEARSQQKEQKNAARFTGRHGVHHFITAGPPASWQQLTRWSICPAVGAQQLLSAGA